MDWMQKISAAGVPRARQRGLQNPREGTRWVGSERNQ